MGGLVLVAIIFGLIYVASVLNRRDEERRLRESVVRALSATCPPHKWEWRKQPGDEYEYLFCEKCKSLPNQYLDNTEEEED